MIAGLRTPMRAAFSAAIMGYAVMGLAMHNDDSTRADGKSTATPGRLSIRLLGPASDIRGTKVPAHILAGQRPRFFQIDEPRLVAVTLPGGKVISMRMKCGSVVTEFDLRTKTAVVVDIELLPLPKSVPYREAFAELRRELAKMGIAPNERMRRRMATWPDDSPGASADFHPHSYRGTMELDDSHGLRVELRPAPDGGWFVVYAFEAGADARRAVWDPTYKAPAKPPKATSDQGAGQAPDTK